MAKEISPTITSESNPDMDNPIKDRSARWRNLFAFWMLGLCNNFGYVVMLSAAHDILQHKFGPEEAPKSEASNSSINWEHKRKCNTVSTGLILLADILPSLVVKVTAPFLPFFVHFRLASCVLLSATGFILVSTSTSKFIAILGVIATSFSCGLGEVTLLSYSHRFSRSTISTWSSGTGGAGIIGALSYAGLTTWLTTENTLLVMLTVPALQAAIFWLVLVHPPQNKKVIIQKPEDGSQEQLLPTKQKTFKEKIDLIPKLLKYMVPLIFVYFFEYFINQGLYELIEFKGIWLSHDEQYRWLQVDYQIGVFISRSSVNFLTIDRIWVMSVLQNYLMNCSEIINNQMGACNEKSRFQLANVFILLFETLFYYIPNIWIIFVLVMWEGLLGGASYVNTFYRMSRKVPREDREAALGIVAMADSIGIAVAGWLSMPVHNAICRLPQPKRLGS